MDEIRDMVDVSGYNVGMSLLKVGKMSFIRVGTLLLRVGIMSLMRVGTMTLMRS